MRKLPVLMPAVLSILLALALTFAAGPTEGMTTISGTVKDEQGSGLDGVLVRLINTDRKVSVSVISRGGGRYSADSLLPGMYEVRGERKGYLTASRQGMQVQGSATVDLTIRKRAGKAEHLTLEDLPRQFPDDPDRPLVFDTCFQCHSMSVETVHTRKDRAGWEEAIRRMAPLRGRTEDEVKRLVNYFTKHFNVDRPVPPPFVTEPEPPSDDPNIRITEYTIPAGRSPKGDHGVANPDRAGIGEEATVHRIAVTPDGVVWFVQELADRIGSLDPRTGQFRFYRVPSRESATAGIGAPGIEAAPDGSIWISEAKGRSRLARLDPKTGEIHEISVCSSNTIIADSQGNIYLTCNRPNQIARVDAKTLEITTYDLLTPNAGPHGIAVDQKDRVWWCQFFADSIGMLDPKTGKVTEYRPPTKLSSPRGIVGDKKGNIWFSELRTSKIGKIEPDSGKITEYDLPTANSDPYELMVDVDDTVWVAGFQSNTMTHFNPATGKFVEYPIPTARSEVRKMSADPKRGVWFAGSRSQTIGHYVLEP